MPANKPQEIHDRAALILDRIAAADAEAKRAQHTDTGALWEMVAELRDHARAIKRAARVLGATAPGRVPPAQPALDLN